MFLRPGKEKMIHVMRQTYQRRYVLHVINVELTKNNYALLPNTIFSSCARSQNAQVRHAQHQRRKKPITKMCIRVRTCTVWLKKQLLLIGRDCFRHAQQMDLPQQHLTRQSLYLTCVTKEERSCGNNPFLTIYLKKYKYHE